MEELKRDFKGVFIPKEIWEDNRLNMLEKGILAEIDSLDNGVDGCFASNMYLATFCHCSEKTVSVAIQKLKDLGYIELESFDGRTRVLRSNRSRQTLQNVKADFTKCPTNNIEDINKNSNINILKETKKENALKVLAYFNEKTGHNYRDTAVNMKFLLARLEDYTVDDLISVIDKKYKEWKGTTMEKYLRIETLFNATKFESYVNQREITLYDKTPTQIQQRDYTDKEMNDIFSMEISDDDI